MNNTSPNSGLRSFWLYGTNKWLLFEYDRSIAQKVYMVVVNLDI